VGVGREAPGNEILHPAARIGTNAPVVGVAWMTDADDGSDPRDSESALVHANVLVAPDPASVTRNVADGGMVTHTDDTATIPRSTDQKPPGVFG
jgi:hypothetical protein